MGRTVIVTENESDKITKIIFSLPDGEAGSSLEIETDGSIVIESSYDRIYIQKGDAAAFLKAVKLAEKEGWFDELKQSPPMKTYKGVLACTGKKYNEDFEVTTTAQDESAAKAKFLSDEALAKYPGWSSYRVLDVEEVK